MYDFQGTLNQIPLTPQFIADLPKIDLHVHLPGTISPQTAWQLGLRNNLLTQTKNGWKNGPASLSVHDPHEHYSDIFHDPASLTFDENGLPKNLRYNITANSFKSFDMIMATVQGHRHPPGGIQTEDDLKFVLRAYLTSCLEQNIYYTEVQQNIRIAYLLYPDLPPKMARLTLYKILSEAAKEFYEAGVYLRFLHCFNKTQAAGLDQSTQKRALEASGWLQESRDVDPTLFVGLQAAGHEKDESGWPIHLKDGYEAAAALGFGCEAHGGEGIGVEHMMDIVQTLPVTRIAHGFQAIEDLNAIQEVKQRNITLVMSPIINLTLGACIHYSHEKQCPLPNSQGGEKFYLETIGSHPFFSLVRDHHLKITLCSDNPEMAGIPIQDLMMVLAGFSQKQEHIPIKWLDCPAPLTTAELVDCLLDGIDAAFCEESIKQAYREKVGGSLKSLFKKSGLRIGIGAKFR